MVSTRKENRHREPAPSDRGQGARPFPVGAAAPKVRPAGGEAREIPPGRGDGKAPFKNRARTLPLLVLFLFSLLFFSFHTPYSPALAAGELAPSFRWPAQGRVVTGFRASSGPYGAGGHSGIDISLEPGSEVRASSEGTVSFAGRTPLGTCVSLVHEGGFKTTYVSLLSACVRQEERVGAGQLLGWSDGCADPSHPGPHLHFGLFLNGTPLDPLPFLEGRRLDPGESLFLGPWEDGKAAEAYFSRHVGAGVQGWLKEKARGLVEGARSLLGGCGRAIKRGLKMAWGWVRAAGLAVGRAFTSFYRNCLRPWLSPLWERTAEAFRALASNRVVRGLAAGLAAALVVCLAVVGIGAVIGLGSLTVILACAVGSLAAVGYAVYHSFASGDSFSFGGCFLGALAVGAVAAGSCLLAFYLAPCIQAGWAGLGWLGFGKSFLVHGVADLVVYLAFNAAAGRKITPFGLLASFLIGGLAGGLGKLVVTGLSSPGVLQAVGGALLSSGGTYLTGGAVQAVSCSAACAYAWGHRAAYMLLCGGMGFLSDLVLRAAAGGVPSLLESALSFAGGVLAGGIGLLGKGEGLAGVLSRVSEGRLRIPGELGRALLSKGLSRGLKEGALSLLRRFKGSKDRVTESWRWMSAGGGD